MGTKIIIQTDHKALTFLKTCNFTNARITRWALAIQDYNIELKHIKDKLNTAADTLSRLSNLNYQNNTNNSDIKSIVIHTLAKNPS